MDIIHNSKENLSYEEETLLVMTWGWIRWNWLYQHVFLQEWLRFNQSYNLLSTVHWNTYIRRWPGKAKKCRQKRGTKAEVCLHHFRHKLIVPQKKQRPPCLDPSKSVFFACHNTMAIPILYLMNLPSSSRSHKELPWYPLCKQRRVSTAHINGSSDVWKHM